ncbi:MAG: amino acid ABC transporter permease [Gammaproteobacteria bacterium]|nr:MAG: amino acid ABC transporter permease [Gammaproteobacteria bacterium]
MSDYHIEPVVNPGNLPDQPPPEPVEGIYPWLRDNLFNSPFNTVLTLLALGLVLWVVPSVLNWLIFNANWTGGNEACRANPHGACWPFVTARWEQFLYGFYTKSERWRIDVLLGILVVGIALLVYEKTPGRNWIGMFMVVVFPVIAFVMMYGNRSLGLRIVETSQWGGFSLTLVIALTGIVASLPLGILLALGRRSTMPVISLLSTIFIEFWRGIPLVAVLFMATIMFPLFLPPGMNFDQLLRAVIGVALFASAYMAEVVRGGLQAIPKGQYEGAMALGLPYWKMMRLIVMPQALKIVIPGIVSTFIGLFKDTTLVLIIALFDLLGIVQASIADPNWSIKSVPYTGYVFVALVFWVCCYGMARYSRYLEAKLHTGYKR